jgi:hypothetical protein
LGIAVSVPVAAQGQTAPQAGTPAQAAGPLEFAYDRQAGRLDVVVKLDPAENRFFGARYRFAIGSEVRDGTCVAGKSGDLRLDLTLVWDIAYGTADMVGGGRLSVSGTGGGVTEAFPTYTYRFAGRALAARGYRCISDLTVDRKNGSPSTLRGTSQDADPLLAGMSQDTAPLLSGTSQDADPLLAGATTPKFNGDFEAGLVPPWTAIHRTSEDRFRLDTARVAEPSQSARVEIRGGDPLLHSGQRSEVLWGSDSALTLRSGDEYYFGWSTWFDSTFPSPGTTSSTSGTGHCLFMQWKDYGTGSPPIDLQCRLDRIQIGYTPKCDGWNIPLQREGWNDFTVRVRFSATNGEIEIWHRAPGEDVMRRKLADVRAAHAEARRRQLPQARLLPARRRGQHGRALARRPARRNHARSGGAGRRRGACARHDGAIGSGGADRHGSGRESDRPGLDAVHRRRRRDEIQRLRGHDARRKLDHEHILGHRTGRRIDARVRGHRARRRRQRIRPQRTSGRDDRSARYDGAIRSGAADRHGFGQKSDRPGLDAVHRRRRRDEIQRLRGHDAGRNLDHEHIRGHRTGRRIDARVPRHRARRRRQRIGHSAPAGATTDPPDTTAPSVPAGLLARASGENRIDLTWTPSTDAVGVTRYDVYEGTTRVGTSTITSFSVTGLAAGSTHTYTVTASDAAGNESGRSEPASATTAVSTRTLHVVAEGDTMVKQASPTSAFGKVKVLLADTQAGSTASTAIHSYLRFNIPALAAGETIIAASLRLHVTNTTGDGPAVYRSQNAGTAAELERITWNSGRPVRVGTTPVGDFAGMLASGVGHSTTVSGITGAGLVTFELAPQSTDDLGFSSREETTTRRPVLTLTVRRG